MGVAKHIHWPIRAAIFAALLLVAAFSTQLTLAQDPEGGVEGANVHECDFDPKHENCPPPKPKNLRLSVTQDDLTATYVHQHWRATNDHNYWLQLHRSATSTGTFTAYRTSWDEFSPHKFNDVARGYYYKFRAKRCRTRSTTTGHNCGDNTDFTSAVYVPPLPGSAYDLRVSRDSTSLKVSFKTSGAGYNRVGIEGRTPNSDDPVEKSTADLSTRKSHVMSGTRGDEYRFRVVRCRDSQMSDCGEWTSWTSWFKIPQLPPEATDLKWKRSGTSLELSFQVDGNSRFSKVEIEGRTSRSTTLTKDDDENLDGLSHSFTATRGDEYRFRVVRCTDRARSDCGGEDNWASWTDWLLVPKIPDKATDLELTRSRNSLKAKYEADGGSYDIVNIYGEKIGDSTSKYSFTAELAYNDDDSRDYVKAVNRDYQYRFKVRRCTDAAHSDCGGWKTWTGDGTVRWREVPELPSDPPKPEIARVKNDLTVSYTASDSSYDKYEIERATSATGRFRDYRGRTENNRKLKGVARNYHYKVSLSRCTDVALTDCTSASVLSDSLLVPNLPPEPGKPTITVTDDDLTVSYTDTGTSNDQMQFQQSDSETSGFTNYTGGTLSGKVLSNVVRNKWYQVRVRRCTDAAFTDCTPWSEDSDAVKVAPAVVQAAPTISSGADGMSVVAEFTLISGFTYTLTLYSSPDDKTRTIVRDGRVTLEDSAKSHIYKGQLPSSGLVYRAVLTACQSRTCTDYNSNPLTTFSKGPAPTITGITLANEDDLTVVYTKSDWTDGAGKFYDFKIRRGDSSSSAFVAEYGDADRPKDVRDVFNNVHTGYYYKALSRRCSDKAVTICGDWSDPMSGVNVPALPAIQPPANVRAVIVSHKEVKATFERSPRPGQTLHRYTIGIGHSDAETGTYVYDRAKHIEMASSLTKSEVSFGSLKADKWYKVRGKRCYDEDRKRCGPWAVSASAVETVSPDPKIEYGGFSSSITIGAGLSKSIVVTAKGLDLTKSYTIAFRTARDADSAADVLKFAKCDATSRPDTDSENVEARRDRSGPVSRRIYGCKAGMDTLMMTLVEGVKVVGRVNLSVSVTPVPKPTNLRANGHSPGTEAQIELQWTAGDGVTKHEYQTALADAIGGFPLTEMQIRFRGQEKELPSTNLVTDLVTDPESEDRGLGRLYAVRLRSVRNGVTSVWSDIVYGFPTNQPTVRKNGAFPVVAGLLHQAFRPNKTYSYFFCANSVPETGGTAETNRLRNQWIADIKTGADAWESAVRWRTRGSGTGDDAFVQIIGSVDHNCDLNLKPKLIKRAEIRVATDDGNLELACGRDRPESCYSLPEDVEDGALASYETTRPYIFFHHSPPKAWNPGKSQDQSDPELCSLVTHFAIHELGHALGLGHQPRRQTIPAVTASPANTKLCEPTPLDIAAMMALYQSR